MSADQERDRPATDGEGDGAPVRSPRAKRPELTDSHHPLPPPSVDVRAAAADTPRSLASSVDGPLSPAAADRVFPVRSVVSVDPTPTPSQRPDKAYDGYFQSAWQAREQARRMSTSAAAAGRRSTESTPVRSDRHASADRASGTMSPARGPRDSSRRPSQQGVVAPPPGNDGGLPLPPRQPPQLFNDIMAETGSYTSEGKDKTSGIPSDQRPPSTRSLSFKSVRSNDEMSSLVTARFEHVVTEGGHAVITGRDGDTLQRCEDEPIHMPGAVQGFGLLIALEEQSEGRLVVRVVSENSKQLIGYTPKQLFALDSFTDILSEEQTDNLLDHIDFIRDDDADVVTNGPEVFTMSIRAPQRKSVRTWCAMHINERHSNLIICEFELEDDPVNPLVPPTDLTPEFPEDTLLSQPTDEEFMESTQNSSKPLRVLRSARKRKGEAAAMEAFNIMSQVQEQLAAAPSLDKFLKVLVGVVKELTGFHRVMIYQFDRAWNGRVVSELVDPRTTKDLYKGLHFPASDIPKQARELYKVNKVRMLYDRDQETARLVCRTVEDLETPLDLTHSYLRAMSPIHLKYLANMAVRSSMSISINAFEELWGLISCHTYGPQGMRVSFPIRKMCRLIGDSASRNIERLSYASRLQARKLINTAPTQNNPSGYIIASSSDLLKLFNADFGLLSIRDETKFLGNLEHSQEALAMLEYLRMRSITNVMTSQDIREDFPDLRYAPGFSVIAGLLLVPLSEGGHDFIVFFRKGQLREVKWAGNPHEKFIKSGTEGYLEPRKSFRTWSETVVGQCREWTEEEIETAAVLCLVYGKFIEVWRQKEAALQNSQLTKLLLANSAHEVRTPLNAIINYLEIALEGSLDQETRENLAKSHSASKSLIYVINDLLDLTKTEPGGDLTKDEIFDLKDTLKEATNMFKGDAARKHISYEVVDVPGLPGHVIGDQRRVRQAISNVTANAIQNTNEGGVLVEMYLAGRGESHVEVEVSVSDTGIGMNAKKLDQLFRELEQVRTEHGELLHDAVIPDSHALTEASTKKEEGRTLGLGLAVVARIIRNMNGQLRLRSEEGVGSRFVIQFPFELPDTEPKPPHVLEPGPSTESITAHGEKTSHPSTPPGANEVTLIERGSASRRGSNSEDRHSRGMGMLRKSSTESVHSGRSTRSRSSAGSGRSEADRLIEAIQQPHRVEGPPSLAESHRVVSPRQSAGAAGLTGPKLDKRHTTSGVGTTTSRIKGRPQSFEGSELPRKRDAILLAPHQNESRPSQPGEWPLEGQRMPIKPVKVPDDEAVPPGGNDTPTASMSELPTPRAELVELPVPTDKPLTADNMRVLVAEDDPINSKIIKKRMEKVGHEILLTLNGEECSTVYADKAGFFDIVLMDMQMPIVDGLTSAKMIRSFEKSHPTHALSARASLNGRVPIIAVSASLLERERQLYIDAGFDGWILKPISFNRLAEIMIGLVDKTVRGENLYKPGRWEDGGWFEEGEKDIFAADTKPSGEPPTSAPGHSADSDGAEVAAAVDDPSVKEDDDSLQTQEQQRLLAEQKDRSKEGES